MNYDTSFSDAINILHGVSQKREPLLTSFDLAGIAELIRSGARLHKKQCCSLLKQELRWLRSGYMHFLPCHRTVLVPTARHDIASIWSETSISLP